MATLTVAAANRSAATRSADAPFDEAHWILDTGADFDMCPPDAPGMRTKRNDLGAIIIANGRAYPDHTITTNIDAIQDKAKCVAINGLTIRLLFGWTPMPKSRLPLLLGAVRGNTILHFARRSPTPGRVLW